MRPASPSRSPTKSWVMAKRDQASCAVPHERVEDPAGHHRSRTVPPHGRSLARHLAPRVRYFRVLAAIRLLIPRLHGVQHWESARSRFWSLGIVHSKFCLSRTELPWEPLQSFDQIQVSGTSRPGSSQLVAAQGPTCRSVGGKHAAKTGQDFCCRDMEATSLCFPFASLARERGKSFSY